MVDALAVREVLENELEWRVAEVRALRNHAAGLEDAARAQFRRAVLLMLYAHYEGFCKAALLEYVRAINGARAACDDVVPAIVAGAWSKIFVALAGDQKSKVFKAILPEDASLHTLARRREFVERLDELLQEEVQFPEDVVDTDSNLWPKLLRRNLYLVGLPLEWVDQYEGAVKRLLYMRNGIAHGADRSGIAEQQYADLEEAVLKVMDGLMLAIVGAVRSQSFIRAAE
ncbi:MAG: hypothetical protein QOK37_2726 [Thermoanaerobaculia bacterium]|jgi:hypothetical protein|nr:hypothetical protein [Thermoanaerobaculia bacterium]